MGSAEGTTDIYDYSVAELCPSSHIQEETDETPDNK
jgi:hypothetical protein